MEKQVRWDSSVPKKDFTNRYLTERKTPKANEFDVTRFDRNVISGGPVSQGYESFVRGLFRPNEYNQMKNAALPPSFTPPSSVSLNGVQRTQSSNETNGRFNGTQQLQFPKDPPQPNFGQQQQNGITHNVLTALGTQKVSAASMRRVEAHLGKDALDDTYDDELWKSPLDSIYTELGLDSFAATRRTDSSQYPTYTPKSSNEYFSTLNSTPPFSASDRSSTLGNYRLGGSTLRPQSCSSFKEKSDREWQKSNRQLLVDYKEFESAPLSPYMYQVHPYVQRQDTRIVGSNFVQLTTRPRDRFLEKIDETLAEVRSSPRYSQN